MIQINLENEPAQVIEMAYGAFFDIIEGNIQRSINNIDQVQHALANDSLADLTV